MNNHERAINDCRLFNAYERSVFFHLLRREGTWESLREISDICGMSVGKCQSVIKRLETDGWILLGIKMGHMSRFANLAKVETLDAYAKLCSPHEHERSHDEQVQQYCSPHEHERSPREQTVHHMNTGVHHVNTEDKNIRLREGLEIKGEERARAREELTPPQKQLRADLIRFGLGELILPLAFALQECCEPVGSRNLAEHAEALFGYDATPDEIKGISNGYWSTFGVRGSQMPYPSQVVSHLHKYRQWVSDGKPEPKREGKGAPSEPAGFAGIRAWAEKHGVDY